MNWIKKYAVTSRLVYIKFILLTGTCMWNVLPFHFILVESTDSVFVIIDN